MPLSDDAKRKMREQYMKAARLEGTLIILFGCVVLGLAYFLASGEVPRLRQGRVVMGFLLGGGAVLYGAARWFGTLKD